MSLQQPPPVHLHRLDTLASFFGTSNKYVGSPWSPKSSAPAGCCLFALTWKHFLSLGTDMLPMWFLNSDNRIRKHHEISIRDTVGITPSPHTPPCPPHTYTQTWALEITHTWPIKGWILACRGLDSNYEQFNTRHRSIVIIGWGPSYPVTYLKVNR